MCEYKITSYPLIILVSMMILQGDNSLPQDINLTDQHRIRFFHTVMSETSRGMDLGVALLMLASALGQAADTWRQNSPDWRQLSTYFSELETANRGKLYYNYEHGIYYTFRMGGRGALQ